MASTIKLKNGSGAPTSGQLVQGEPALDLTNKRLYTENASGTVIEVGTNPSSLTIGGTALTATAAELNTLDGITATTAELNTLDGITATVTELNYTDGVTSNIQTQLNTKAPIASPTFTGTVTAPAVNVNGTVTADGLTVEASPLIQAASAGIKLLETDTTDLNTLAYNNSGIFRISTANDAFNSFDTRLSIDHATGDLSLFEDTGTTAKFFWDASAESLGIGTSSPTYALDVVSTGSSVAGFYGNSGTSFTYFGHSGGTNGAYLYNDNQGNTIIDFNQDANVGTQSLRIRDNGTERARLDSSGNWLVGKTSTSFSTAGVQLNNDGQTVIIKSGGSPLYARRTTDSGHIVEFAGVSATIGYVGGNSSGYLYTGAVDTALIYDNGNNSIQPYQPNIADYRDNAIDLGAANARFKDLYLSGGVYLGGTGAANKLDDYEEGTFTATLKGSTTEPATLVTTTARYTKVGNAVSIAVSFENIDTTGYAGQITVTGVPFVNNSSARAQLSVGHYQTTTWDTGEVPVAQLGVSSTTIIFQNIASGTVWSGNNHNAGTARFMWATGTYIAA